MNEQWEKMHQLYGNGMAFGLATDKGTYPLPEWVIDQVIADKAALAEANARVEEQRLQLRNAWAKLGCRCIFNDQNEKTFEEPHCPYHGIYQNDQDGWDPIGELQARVEALEGERDAQKARADSWQETAEKVVAMGGDYEELEQALSAERQRAERASKILRTAISRRHDCALKTDAKTALAALTPATTRTEEKA